MLFLLIFAQFSLYVHIFTIVQDNKGNRKPTFEYIIYIYTIAKFPITIMLMYTTNFTVNPFPYFRE